MISGGPIGEPAFVREHLRRSTDDILQTINAVAVPCNCLHVTGIRWTALLHSPAPRLDFLLQHLPPRVTREAAARARDGSHTHKQTQTQTDTHRAHTPLRDPQISSTTGNGVTRKRLGLLCAGEAADSESRADLAPRRVLRQPHFRVVSAAIPLGKMGARASSKCWSRSLEHDPWNRKAAVLPWRTGLRGAQQPSS